MGDDSNFLIKLWVDTRGYVLFIALAVWGGTVNYISKNNKEGGQFSWTEWVGEITVSGFAGVLVALIGIEMEWSVYITAFMARMAGHMGGRALYIFEILFRARMGGK